MEELQDPFLAERTQKGGARSTCGFGARPASSAATIMADYTEIFGGFSAFCSIPVLVLPEAMEGYGEALLESQSMNYSEIFGDLDAGIFPLLYEELLSTEKGSKEGDDRFQEGPNGGQFERGVFEQLDVPIREHIKISNVNQKCSTFYSSLNTEQLNISGRSGQKSLIDEVKSTICSFGFQANCGPDFEADTASSTGLVEDDENPKTIETDDHILSGYMEEEKGGKEEEFLNACFVGIDGSENDLNDDHKPYKYSPLESKDKDLKQHSPSSSYHSTSSGDLFSDYSFLTVSDISLQTQPLQVPPPSRAPPKLDMKQEMPKSEVFEASDTTFSAELIPETYKGYQGHHVGVPRTRHALKETAKSNYPIYLNVEVDASSAAAASAAAIVEAMEQAQSSLKSAKELMERNRESPQSGRRINSHYFGSWNEQSISFAGRLRHRTPKLAQKLVPNQVEMANPNFSEHAEGEAQGKESEFSLLSDERERFHEWKIGKQFYELVGSDKLMRTRVISDEKYTRDEAAPIARQFFPEKETYGTHKKINSHSDNENKMENLHKYRSEKKLYSGGELQVQDSNAKNLKFGDTVENEEMFDILETSDLKSVRGDDEDKQKVGTVIQLRDESKFKAQDGIRLIKHDRNEKELKECPESSIHEAGEKNEDNKELNSHGRNDSGIMDFYSDSKLEGFGNEAVGKKLGEGKEFDEIPETSIVSEVFNYNSTSEIKKFMVKLSSLENVNEAVVEKECRKSFSSDKENLEEMRDDCQLGKLNKTIRETYIIGYKEGKYSELKGIDSTSVNEVNGKFSEANISSEPEKNEKLKHEQSDKLNTLNRSEAKVGKVSVWPDFLANAKDEFNLKQNEEKKKEYELKPKFENFVDKLTADEEQRKGDKNLIGTVQAAVELEKKIKRLCTDQQGLQRIRVQDDEAIQQSKSLSASVNSSGSLLKQMEKSIPSEWRDANYIHNDLSDSERKEAEQKRILEEERDREREKDRIAVKKTSESCEKVFPESRERHEKFAEVSERSETIANEVKLRVERAAVERATVEARERAIERSLAEQASLAARRQAETLTNVSKEKSRKQNTSGGIVWPGEKDSEIILKPASNVHDAPIDANSQMAGLEEESPLRCKARKERHQRMVERAAKALAEKNMRDLLAQKEQVERNRLAESLDAEVKRWSNGKEGNLRALLSTLQYILGHDSGWQPIPLTEVITSAAVRKAYRKATLYVHPDKLQQRGAIIQHKYICEKVFDLLKDAWNRFNSEGW